MSSRTPLKPITSPRASSKYAESEDIILVQPHALSEKARNLGEEERRNWDKQ